MMPREPSKIAVLAIFRLRGIAELQGRAFIIRPRLQSRISGQRDDVLKPD